MLMRRKSNSRSCPPLFLTDSVLFAETILIVRADADSTPGGGDAGRSGAEGSGDADRGEGASGVDAAVRTRRRGPRAPPGTPQPRFRAAAPGPSLHAHSTEEALRQDAPRAACARSK
eukprot:3001123-Rhodomonas_salina.1